MKDKNESFFEYIKKNKYNIIKIIIVLGIGIMIGMTIQKLLNNKKSSEKLPNQMNQVYNSLLKEYKEEINESDLEQAAIKGMIESNQVERGSERLTTSQEAQWGWFLAVWWPL